MPIQDSGWQYLRGLLASVAAYENVSNSRYYLRYYPLAQLPDRLGINVHEGGLTSDIPLGPFEGTLIPAYAATKAGRLHARPDCPRLRADHVSELKVPLNSVSIERMCAECTRWGGWALPGAALGMYLKVFSGYGLTYQLDSYIEPNLDDFVTDKEIADVAALLRYDGQPSSGATGDANEEPNEDEWLAFTAARELCDSRIVP
jgi:hypothetical protein